MDHIDKKKILFLITQSKYGGAQKYLLALARHFSQNNEVLIAVGEKEQQDERFFSEARNLGIEPIVLNDLIRDISLVKAWDALLELRKLYVKERPDFVHINSSMAGAIGSCAAWLYRFDPMNRTIRVIYTVHGFVFNEPLPSFKKLMYRMIEKISASWKGALICVSQYDKEQGLKHKIAPDKRIVVVHNGIERNAPLLDRAAARERLGIPADSFVVGTIASLYPTKGLTYLLDAAHTLASTHPNLQYHILGDGPLHDELSKKIADLKLTSAVHLHGSIPEASTLLKAFDIFALPSMKEGFPYALLEAGAAGLPVIASRVGGIPELIEHQTHGILTEAGNADDLSIAIKTLANDRTIREKYATALHDRVHKEFTLEKMLKETEQIYLKFYPTETTSSTS